MATTKTKKTKAAHAPRQSKKATIVEMLQRKNGASIEEMVEATGWLGDSVRGQMSLLGSREGLKILSSKTGDARRYFIRAGKASKK